MKILTRIVGVIVLAILGFVIVSYVMFGNNPESRLKLELDHDLPVGAIIIRTESAVEGCDLNLTLSQIDADETVLVGEKLSVSFQALAGANTTPGRGYIEFALPDGEVARCVDLNGQACSRADRSDVQLNMPKIKTPDQADRVIGWINELAETCEG